MTQSTIVVLIALIAAAVSALVAGTADQAFRYSAVLLGAGLALATTIEGQAGLRNIVRVDLFMLAVLYLLTFFEFLLPQAPIDGRVSLAAAQTAVFATLVGFAGIAVGRHVFPPNRPLPRQVNFRVSPRLTMTLLLGCAFLGYLYMLVAVNFDVIEMINQMSRPRFSQPWTRGRYGDFSTLLYEFGLLKFLLPPLAAAVLAQRRRFSILQQAIAGSILGLVLYEGFTGGTRNVFLTHLVTFAVTFVLLMRRPTLPRAAAIAAPIVIISWFAIYYLPEIRTVGLQNFDLDEARTSALFVDMNLVNIALLTEVFPEQAGYLGLEIPFNAAIRPIPRALWSGKPEGLSLSIEQALGATGLTLAATFVGELWMAGGYLAVGSGALAFGAAAARWNRVGARASTTTQLILFASGFFPAGICMRSFLSVAPTILPIIGLLVFLRFFHGRRKRGQTS